MTKKKTYIGTTPEGERTFIEWELQDKNDKLVFSASGHYLNKAGTDHSQSWQCLDTIAEDYLDSEQAQNIHAVWKRYHLNDMNAGTPEQMRLIREVIEPKVEAEIEAYDKLQKQGRDAEKRILSALHNQTASLRENANWPANLLFKAILNRAAQERTKKDSDYRTKPPFVIFTWNLDGEWSSRPTFDASFKVRVKRPDMEALCHLYEVLPERLIEFTPENRHRMTLPYEAPTTWKNPAYISWIKRSDSKRPSLTYDRICEELQQLGRLHDPSVMRPIEENGQVIGEKAYRYGHSWLHEDLPQHIIDEIESWEEVPEPDEMTPIEQFIHDNNVTIKHVGLVDRKWIGSDESRFMTAWKVSYDGKFTLDFFTGTGLPADDPDSYLADAVSCHMEDAKIGKQEDPIQYMIDEMGWDYKVAKEIATAWQKTAELLGDLYDEDLAR